MDTSRVDGVKASLHAASALSEIFRGLLIPRGQPSGSSVIRNLRVDLVSLFTFSSTLSPYLKVLGATPEVERAARR